jgi:predicted amidohydrolase
MWLTPRVAISQAPYQRDLETSLARALDHMRQARQLGADLVVFPEWFLGLNPLEVLPNRQTDILAGAARELSLMVVTGSLRALDPHTGKKQQRALVIDWDGRIVGNQAKCEFYAPERPWFEPAERVLAINTRFGRLVLLLGLDATSPQRWQECREEAPDLVVMATSPRTQRERNQLADLVLARSLEIGGLVVLAPLYGRFAGSTYVGGALAASKGRLLADGGDGEKVVFASAAGGALIQLGVADSAAWVPIAPVPERLQAPSPAGVTEPEPERRVLLDWGLLRVDEPLPGGRQLLAQASDSPRTVALAPVVPGREEALVQLLAEGARGGYMWPAMTGLASYDPAWLESARLLQAKGRPLSVQLTPGPYPLRHSRPLDLDDLALACPTLPMVLLGAGAHSALASEALLLASLRDNVWLDTSGAPVEMLVEAARTLGPDRLLFSTGGRPNRFEAEWAKLKALQARHGLKEEQLAALAGGNARRLFFNDSPPGISRSPDQPQEAWNLVT